LSIASSGINGDSSDATSTSTSTEQNCLIKKKIPPPIPYGRLTEPETVVTKYKQFLKASKFSTLAVCLAKKSIFL